LNRTWYFRFRARRLFSAVSIRTSRCWQANCFIDLLCHSLSNWRKNARFAELVGQQLQVRDRGLWSELSAGVATGIVGRDDRLVVNHAHRQGGVFIGLPFDSEVLSQVGEDAGGGAIANFRRRFGVHSHIGVVLGVQTSRDSTRHRDINRLDFLDSIKLVNVEIAGFGVRRDHSRSWDQSVGINRNSASFNIIVDRDDVE
jgi:hypothetical protein